LFAGITARFPGLKIAFSEAGIGWVPMILERLGRLAQRSRFEATPLGGAYDGALEGSVGAELLRGFRENYWFTTLGEPIAFGLRDHIGTDRIMFECDYPHSDTLWPDVQETLAESSAGLDRDTVARLAYANAAELYRHPLPADR
jgi:predicted TIM-barrel fold metal-dependent hydrolase